MNIKFTKTLNTLWAKSVEILPTLIAGLLILIGGWVIAKIVSKVVLNLLRKTKSSKLSKWLNLDDISERLNIKISFSLIVSKVVYWVIFLFFIIGASDTFGWTNVSQQLSIFVKFLPRVLSALLIFSLGYAIATFLRGIIKSITKSMGIGLGNFLGEFVFYFLLLIVSITALSQAGVDTSILASQIYILVGAFALTVSLSLSLGSKEVVGDLLKNYYNRDVLIEGDKVELKNITGKISKISKTSIVVETETEKIVIPSSEFYNNMYKIIK